MFVSSFRILIDANGLVRLAFCLALMIIIRYRDLRIDELATWQRLFYFYYSINNISNLLLLLLIYFIH